MALLTRVALLCGVPLAAAAAVAIGKDSGTAALDQQFIFSNPPDDEQHLFNIPSVHESAIMARRILHLTTVGTLVTSFPDASPSTSSADHDSDMPVSPQENRPSEVAHSPIGLMEYYADCEPTTGNPILLALSVATPMRNYAAGSNISLSLRWWPEQTTSYSSSSSWAESWSSWLFKGEDDNDDDDAPFPSTPHTPAALPRLSLHGHLEPLDTAEAASSGVAACFVHAHPDAAWWQPGNPVHAARYVRLVVEHVYWLGGFGDRARIQWLPIEEWRNVSMREVAECRLPGERRRRRGGWWEGWKVGL